MRILAVLLVLAAIPAAAQDKPAPRPPLFQTVIPKPTGENGYEELVRAVDYLGASERWKKYDTPRATLAQKRSVLQEIPVRRALQTLEAGLKKPIVSVRPELTFSTTLPELAQFRSLGRLLAVKQYVELADGKTREAIQTARLSFRFSRVIQMDTLIGGLVGVAITRITIRPLAQRLDQLSASDCDQLYRVCVEAMSTPEVTASLIAGERRGIRSSLAEFERMLEKDGADAVETLFGPVTDPPMDDAEREQYELVADLKALYRNDPTEFRRALAESERKVDEYLGRQLEQSKLPPWKRDRKRIESDGTPAGRIAGALSTDFSRIQDRFTEERHLLQQLAVHVAIRRYRWENDRLPDTLEVLNLGILELDPFTGAPLVYKVDGAKYALTSPGYPVAADDPLGVDGRRPVALIQ